MIKIRLNMTNNVNIFTIYEYLKRHKNFTDNLAKQHLNSGKKEEIPNLVITKHKLYQLFTSYLNIIFGRTY